MCDPPENHGPLCHWISDFSAAAKCGWEHCRTTFLVFVHSLWSLVALEQPGRFSRFFLGVILLGIWRTNITSRVISSWGECGQVCNCKVFCCSLLIHKGNLDYRHKDTQCSFCLLYVVGGIKFYIASTWPPQFQDAFIRICISP